MKLHTKPLFKDFLERVFAHLKKNGIDSCVYPVDDLNALKNFILESEFVEFKPNPFGFGLDFRIPEKGWEKFCSVDPENFVGYFIFKKSTEDRGGLLVDLVNSQTSIGFIDFSLSDLENFFFYPEFDSKFKSEKCISPKEFQEVLDAHYKTDRLNVIEVD